ncbi:uncharacterized protein L201_007537 [Kwoniella dendrophila CBS 6074]|uniref:Uncharacterized protein n=1 Tax=Kwoniella dendrophila CBS 6074 TaxID=1295534 RepID=A0AAX4K728_9TREE
MRRLLATFAFAFIIGLTNHAVADNFANFFTGDSECNEDGSIGFDLNNPGCFSQRNMGSDYIPNNGRPWTNGKAKSYRFISGGCDDNNC